MYKDNIANAFSRKTHKFHYDAFDSYDAPAGSAADKNHRIYALVGGEVIEAKNGKNIRYWGYNGTVAIYNQALDKTFIYWHLAEGSINEGLEGKIISAGDLIGKEGSTGNSTGNHTHVEIHNGRSRVNMSNPNAPSSPANSGRQNVANVFQDATRKGLTIVGQADASTVGVHVPSTTTQGNITRTNFSGTDGPSRGVTLRNSPRLSDRSGRNEPKSKRLQFDAWTTGQAVKDLWTEKSDSRWFRVKGTDLWVPSGYIDGNPGNNTPETMPIMTPRPTTPFQSNLPDARSVINYMAQEFSRNSRSSIVGYLQKLNSSSGWGGLSSSVKKTMAYILWGSLVKPKGIWDHKDAVRGRSNGNQNVEDRLTNRVYQYESWSNMHYGYLGRVAGFSESELINGAGLAQISTNSGGLPSRILSAVEGFLDNPGLSSFTKLGTVSAEILTLNANTLIKGSNPRASLSDLSSIDDPKDKQAIKEGFRLYSRFPGSIDESDFISHLRTDSEVHAYTIV